MRYFILLLLCLCAIPEALYSKEPIVDLREVLSAKEYAAAGLSQLTSNELRRLNAVTNRLLSEAAMAGCKEELSKARALIKAVLPIESSIDGDFEGWDGDTIFVLENGQVWRQDSYAYLYEYAYNPDVSIVLVQGRHAMLVEGVDEFIFVRPN